MYSYHLGLPNMNLKCHYNLLGQKREKNTVASCCQVCLPGYTIRVMQPITIDQVSSCSHWIIWANQTPREIVSTCIFNGCEIKIMYRLNTSICNLWKLFPSASWGISSRELDEKKTDVDRKLRVTVIATRPASMTDFSIILYPW